MLWLDWNWRVWGIGGYIEHAPAWATFPPSTKAEIWIGPLTITGLWNGKESNVPKKNCRR